MTKTFKEIIDGIRTAILGIEVREDIAQGMEYVEQFATTATQKSDEAAASAAKAEKASQDTEAAKETAVSAINTAKSEATDEINTEKSGALSAIGNKKAESLQELSKKQGEALNEISGSVSTAQDAAGTAVRKAAAATGAASAAKTSETNAGTSASNAKGSETKSGEYLQATKEYFEQVRTITLGAQGWYETSDALTAAVPVGENGWWAVVGTTDSIWVWDRDTNAWRDSMVTVNMSDYYTRTQVDEKLTDKANKTADDLNTMINALTTGASTPTDADYYVSQYVGGGSTTTTYHRRPMSALWTYIKSKADSVFAAKSHTHNYAGSDSAGGSANSAVKLDTATAGSATKPVYIIGGKPVACTHSLGKDVPANAVFTDHTYAKMTAATASAAGKEGLVPAPAAGAQGKFLRGDGTWQAIATSGLSAYPVGSIYQSTDPTSPAALFGGTWEQIASERVLMGASSSHKAGTTVNAGLPNITGTANGGVLSMSTPSSDGAFGSKYYNTNSRHGGGDNGDWFSIHNRTFDASKSNPIYGASNTVQPAAYYVYIWHRVS